MGKGLVPRPSQSCCCCLTLVLCVLQSEVWNKRANRDRRSHTSIWLCCRFELEDHREKRNWTMSGPPRKSSVLARIGIKVSHIYLFTLPAYLYCEFLFMPFDLNYYFFKFSLQQPVKNIIFNIWNRTKVK